MARTRLRPGSVNPGLLPQARRIRPAAPVGAINLGPADGSLARQQAASAESEVRPGPRPPTLRPYRPRTGEAGPEALSTPSLPIICFHRPRKSVGCLRADLPIMSRWGPDPRACDGARVRLGRFSGDGRRLSRHLQLDYSPGGVVHLRYGQAEPVPQAPSAKLATRSRSR